MHSVDIISKKWAIVTISDKKYLWKSTKDYGFYWHIVDGLCYPNKGDFEHEPDPDLLIPRKILKYIRDHA